MKIKHKISLITVTMCIMCIGALWMVNKFLSARYMVNTIQDKVLAEVKLKANEINSWIEKEKQNLNTIAERVILAKDYEFDTLYKVLEETGEMNFGNLYYFVLEDGTFVDVSGWVPDEGYNPLTREWCVKAQENRGQIYVCDPYVDAMTSNLVLTLSKEITLNDGRKGVLGVDMQISDMNEMLNSIGKNTEDAVASATLSNADYENTLNKVDGSYIFLIDRRGNIISHPNPEFAAKPDRLTKASDILGGKLNKIRKTENLSLEQRMIKDYDQKVRAFFFDTLEGADWNIGIAVEKDTILEAQNKFIKAAISLSAVLLCAAIIISVITAGSIAKPIMETKTIANNIANLKLNIDIDNKYLKRKDETGEIAKAIKETIKKLRDFTGDLNELSTINNKIYNTTLEKANTLQNLSEGVSATTEELSAGMEETSATAETISQSVDELNSAASIFAGKTEEGAKTANEIAIKAAELDRQFKESKDNTMNILSTAKEEIEAALDSAKNVEQVKILADAILDIATKTNLLALNASIEAARAGENGRGFAVVAEQIRTLSEDSNRSAGSIKQFAEDINVSVNKLISSTYNLLKFLDENVLNDYGLMLNAIENYKNDGSVLSDVLSELSNTVNELTATINIVATSINDVSATIQQATAATINIAEQNSEMVDAVQDINNAMQMNAEASNKITGMISQVKL